MITALIADDVTKNRQQIEKLLKLHFTDVQVVASCPTYEDAETALVSFQPQLLILDIELNNGKLSFDLLKTYTNENAALVFITAYSQYAIQAIELSCCDYVLKPYTEVQLVKAIEKAKHRFYEQDNLHRIKLLVDNIQAKSSEGQMIALPDRTDRKAYKVVPLTNVLYVESQHDHTCRVVAQENTNQKKPIESILSQGIGAVSECFANLPAFIRVHSQYLVNLQSVTHYHKTDSLLTMVDGKEIPVSRENRQMVAKLLRI